jgi:cystathionine beta-lyase/cystathionine gamma-synthase
MKKKNTHILGTRIPIYRDAAFFMGTTGQMKQTFELEKDHPRDPGNYIYSRYRNPTVAAVEEQFMALENCEWALLTQSGMAAIDVALSIFQKAADTGTWLFFSEIYGGTNHYIDRVLKYRRGIDIQHFYPSGESYDLAKLQTVLDEVKPRLIFFEAISNPMLMVADCEEIIALAKKAGAIVIMDNTFATPYLFHPLELGADMVIHSVTKYLSGHNDISAGVLCGNDPQMAKDAIEYRKYVGHMMTAEEAYALDTQLRTFNLRVEKQNQNAARLANVLSEHPNIQTVLYPGLESHPTHNQAVKLFKGKGFGAIVTFDIKADGPEKKAEAAQRFLSAVAEDIPLVPTLGDVSSILLHVESVWGDKYALPGMFRLSVGIEEYGKLEKVVLTGLEAAGQALR